MYPRTRYEMTEDDLKTLLEAMKPVPMMMIGSYAPRSQQENANVAWAELGKKMGFDSMTVEPIPGLGMRFFSAVANETEFQKKEREERENQERLRQRISTLETEIKDKKEELSKILNSK